LIRNDASLKSDADALVGLLLKGASMPWSKLVRRLVDGASDGLDHLGELGAQGPIRLDGARDESEVEMVLIDDGIVLVVLARSGVVGGIARVAVGITM
jgi:hypothetical protein